MTAGQTKAAAIIVLVLIALTMAYFGLQAKSGGINKLLASGRGESATVVGGHGRAAYGESENIGPTDAKVQIIAVVPIQNPCHKDTIAVLKDMCKAYPEDIYLTLVDFFGPDAEGWKQELQFHCATVHINGESVFDIDGREVAFEQFEGIKYKPEDLKTVIEAEIAKLG